MMDAQAIEAGFGESIVDSNPTQTLLLVIPAKAGMTAKLS